MPITTCLLTVAFIAATDGTGRSLKAGPKVEHRSWFATYAGMKDITDDYYPHNTVPQLYDRFFMKYPKAHRAVWEKHGVEWDTIENRVFTFGVGVRLNEFLSETQFNWPEKSEGFAKWWEKDVLGPVVEVYGDFLYPKSLNNADLDDEYRKVLKREPKSELTNEDRRIGLIEIAGVLNEHYHSLAVKQPKMFVDRNAKLLKAWKDNKALK